VTLEIVARRDDFSSKEHRTPNIERRTLNAEHRTPNIERRTLNAEHRTPNIELRTAGDRCEDNGVWPTCHLQAATGKLMIRRE
jgi:hypothetical protein